MDWRVEMLPNIPARLLILMKTIAALDNPILCDNGCQNNN